MEGIVNYSYRGVLKSCNYTCDYCPFSKTTVTQATIRSDREALFRFCDYIENLDAETDSLQIFLLPYGEGMIHRHYTEALARLSALPSVHRVSCQTNLSWNINRFANGVRELKGELSRISFWCSFHPQCTELADFIEQCTRLGNYGIRYCAGMVAKPGYESLAEEMRTALPASTYMWLNAMDGLNRNYTAEETARFSAIDPLFSLNCDGLPANESDCRGGKDSLFVKADGRTALCPVAGKYAGNLYKNNSPETQPHCKATNCNCYLAYSNREASGLSHLFGRGTFLRIPERTPLKSLFLDVDGTLLDANGELYPRTEKALAELSKTCRLYFATELPYLHAQKKCASLFPLFAGGIFAGGAHIRMFRPATDHYFYLPAETAQAIETIIARYNIRHKTRIYRTTEGIYRIAITGNYPEALYTRLSAIPNIRIETETGLLTIVEKQVDKGKAIAHLLRQTACSGNEALAIGNDISDIAMFRQVKYAVSVPGSPQTVQEHSRRSMPVSLLPVFFGG